MASECSKNHYFSGKNGQSTTAELEFIEENAIDGSGQKERPSPTHRINASNDKRTVSAQLVRDVILDNFEDANQLAESSYEDVFSYLSSDTLRGMLSDGIDLMGNFEVLAEELGIDPNTNEAYLTVKEQTITDYPELIGLAEEIEQNADRYFSRTSGI